MKDLVLTGDILEELRKTQSELLIDLAVYLYDKEQLRKRRKKIWLRQNKPL